MDRMRPFRAQRWQESTPVRIAVDSAVSSVLAVTFPIPIVTGVLNMTNLHVPLADVCRTSLSLYGPVFLYIWLCFLLMAFVKPARRHDIPLPHLHPKEAENTGQGAA